MTLPPPIERRSRGKTLFNLALAVGGAVLLLLTVRRVGWASVQSGLTQVGWWFVAVVLLGGLRFLARTRAWMACADAVVQSNVVAAPVPAGTEDLPSPRRSLHDRPSGATGHFFGATLAADALGNLTPLGLLASEPAKILLTRRRLSTVTAVVSVAAENAFYIASVIAMVAAGAAVFIGVAELPAGLRSGVQAVLAATAAAALIAVFVARSKPALLSKLARTLSSLTGRGQTSAGHLQAIEAGFYDVLSWPLHRLAGVAGWEALFHVAAVAEVFLVLRLLPGGSEVSLADAFVLETTGRLIAVAFKFVPYRLGVDEAGTALVAAALALDPTVGVTLALIRRLRIFFWNAIGLVILGRSR